ncbi:MAG TPA: hypothetical protein VFI39_05145 [Gemmatimonadales bacterium]|nr:hypothetical protein [Gemmatimonadales bacterium]
MPSRDRGVALLEALIALAILGIAGVSLVGLLVDVNRGEWSFEARELRSERADQLLTHLSLEDKRGLDIRLGRRAVGEFVTDVERPEPGLYRVAVADSAAPDAPLLVTVVYRPGAE